jgi:hypothetical protein
MADRRAMAETCTVTICCTSEIGATEDTECTEFEPGPETEPPALCVCYTAAKYLRLIMERLKGGIAVVGDGVSGVSGTVGDVHVLRRATG